MTVIKKYYYKRGIQMTQKIQALEAQKELVLTALNDEENRLKERAKQLVTKYLAEPHQATITRLWLNSDYLDKLSIRFEIGFWNDAENRIDFGSDIWCCYEEETKKLVTNYGTCGQYSKDDIYQVKRVMLLADLFRNIEVLETEFENICLDSNLYCSLDDQYDDIIREIESIESAIKEQELKDLEATLKVGSRVKYDESVGYHYREFKDWVDSWYIHRIGEKTIKLRAEHLEQTRQLSKREFLRLVSNKKIIITED